MSAEQLKTDDDVIDFAKIKSSFTGLFKGKGKGKEERKEPTEPASKPEHHAEDTIAIDFQKIKTSAQKHARWIIPLLCILIAMSVSIYLRTMPQRLPIADDWAASAVGNFYQNQLQEQIRQQYPNLPEQNQQALMANEWQKYQQENKELLDSQTQQLAEQYRNNFRDDNGTLYLLGIDPYYYYRQAGLILKNGYPGTAIKDGKIWDYYRLAPSGREEEWDFHPWFGAQWHRFLNLFGNFPLMFTFFFVGTIFSALTVIPGFFIGRKITKNNIGGFFVAMLLAVSSFFVARTTGESSDTDVYAVFFSVLIVWLFIEAMEAKEKKWKWCWSLAAGFSTGLFAFAWTGWWYTSTFILATLLFDLLYHALHHWRTKQAHQAYLKDVGHTAGAYFLSAALFVSLFTSFQQLVRVLLGPFQFLRLKAVAVTSYWPNIRTTVAELNVPSFSNVIEQLGGNLLLALAILGILLLLFRKNEAGRRSVYLPFLFSLWLVASLFATTKGVRFILQATPVFAIALGIGLGLAWSYGTAWLSRELKLNRLVVGIILFILLSLFLLSPIKSGYSQAFNSAPSMNDGWYNALTKIKNEAPENIIITSWWDFGHWFKAVADRPVTFDGGTQVSWGAHWAGKSLLTNDERNSIGIVRMLNCGQNTAFEKLDAMLNDTPKSIDILNEIVRLGRTEAAAALIKYGLAVEQAEKVLQYTHCAAPPTDYYITSEDMVGKAGVWGHFGSWNFKKAVMHKETRNLNREEAVRYLTGTFNLTPEEAARIHGEVLANDADRWIAPWPGYSSGWNPCQQLAEKEIRCLGSVQGQQFALRVDLDTYNATFEGNSGLGPNTIVYATKDEIKEKDLGYNVGFSVMVVPEAVGDNYKFMIADPLQANSMFAKLFFLEGHGQKCFQKFDDRNSGGMGRIITWIVDYDCKQENKIYFLSQEQVHAAHLLISTAGRSEEEALALAESLRQNVTTENFAEYATQYSEDPGSKQQGGDLGWFKKGQMVAPFEEAAFSLRPGQISEPVKTQFGYHLIYVLEKKNE